MSNVFWWSISQKLASLIEADLADRIDRGEVYIVKLVERIGLVCLSLASLLALLFSVWACLYSYELAPKAAGTASILLALTGLLQLEVSGLFSRMFDVYADEEEYPYGPPSHVNRIITDVPDVRALAAVRGYLFFDMRVGFWLLVCSSLTDLVSVWI